MHNDRHHADLAGLATPHVAAVSIASARVAFDADATPHPGLSPSGKSETPELAGGGRLWEQTKSCKLDCAVPAAADQYGDAAGKALATLRARLALAGWALLQNPAADGAAQFLATRWGHGRDLRDLAAVEAFARQVGAPC